jgi:hypothetical protein
MAKIPLNKFKAIYRNIGTTMEEIYNCGEERAGVVVNMMASNNTNQEIKVNVQVNRNSTLFTILTNFPVPAYDARSLVTGRMILNGNDGANENYTDYLLVGATLTGCTLSFGVLETVNRN